MKKIILEILAVVSVVLAPSCSKSIDYEQYENYVSFGVRHPSTTVIPYRIKYRGEATVYKFPVLVSGTLQNNKNLDVDIAVDADTLATLNYDKFGSREDLYFRQMPEDAFSLLNTPVNIKGGESSGLLEVEFNINKLDQSQKWMLPLEILPSDTYIPHPRKDFSKALLWVIPFNDYSGEYGTTNLSIKSSDSNIPLIVKTRNSYVIDEHSIFFYAGSFNENHPERAKFKMKASFEPVDEFSGNVLLEAMDESLELTVNTPSTYRIVEVKDETLPNTLLKTVIINLDYSYVDNVTSSTFPMDITVKGSMSMGRKIRTDIPDEEFAIQWED